VTCRVDTDRQVVLGGIPDGLDDVGGGSGAHDQVGAAADGGLETGELVVVTGLAGAEHRGHGLVSFRSLTPAWCDSQQKSKI
jgi:hypothetical protein